MNVDLTGPSYCWSQALLTISQAKLVLKNVYLGLKESIQLYKFVRMEWLFNVYMQNRNALFKFLSKIKVLIVFLMKYILLNIG